MNRLKRNLVVFVFFLFSLSCIFGNPFFSSDAPNPSKSTQGTLQENKELTEKQNSKSQETKRLQPVRVTATTEESVKLQGDLREKIAQLFFDYSDSLSTKKESSGVLWKIALIAFLYGIIHAAGPGHRKTIIFSLYLSRKSPCWEPCVFGLVLAGLHAGCAILLVFVYRGIVGAISQHTEKWSLYLEGFSYVVIILTAIVFIIVKIIQYVKSKNNTNSAFQDKSFSLLPFFISGIYPCPGVILVLILSTTLQIFDVGIFAVLAMSLGMAIPIIVSGYIAWLGKVTFFNLLKSKEKHFKKISFFIELSGYVIMLFFSVYVAYPFINSLF